MAQTRKRRRRKHRGTQGGRIDRRPARGRARSRAEAQARARSRTKKGPREPSPPSWGSSFQKGALGAVLFVGVLALFGTNPIGALVAGIVLMPAYAATAYLMDRFFYRRHLRKEAQKRAEREAERRGVRETEG